MANSQSQSRRGAKKLNVKRSAYPYTQSAAYALRG
jgi:hypothetical protein